MSEPLLEVRAVSKSFPGVKALQNVSLDLQEGEVLAVIGENGAGKSTLMKILAGVQQQDEGELRLRGRNVSLPNVSAALREGIVLIHQELNLAENLDVGSNIALGREPRRLGFVNRRAVAKDASRVLAMLDLDMKPRDSLEEMSIGRRQMVEIAKALSCDAKILIMDEPTSSLSSREADRLFEVVDALRERGVSIIYISHRLGEVKRLADRVVVLRDGTYAGTLQKDEITHDAMVRLMIGRDVSQFYDRTARAPGEVAFEVRRLRTEAHPEHEVSLSVREGEIVGIAGLVGAGRTELLRAMFGIDRHLGGEIRVDGERRKIRTPRDAIRAGLALAPEDRKDQGLVIEFAVRQNVSLASLARDQRLGFLNRKAEYSQSASIVSDLRVRTPTDRQEVGLLSGGNQQKVVLGKWLVREPRVLLLDEPTRGVDIGAKHEIYSILEENAQRGVAVLFVSSEMEEVIGLADRVLVMHEGRLAGELARDEVSEEAIMRLATGGAS